MDRVTYFVALPFGRDPEGNLCAGEPIEARSADAARRRAASMAATHGGAIAFSRTGDIALGDFEEAHVLGRFGDVPENAIE